MTANEFRKMALALPEVVESSHMGHPDFRVGGKIFATFAAPDPAWAMVKLTPEEQEMFGQIDPQSFQPVKGGWGRQGATNVRLRAAKKSVVREALLAAWRHRAPQKAAGRLAEASAPLRRARRGADRKLQRRSPSGKPPSRRSPHRRRPPKA